MSDVLTETPESTEPVIVEPAPTIKEHFAQFGPEAMKADPADATDEQRPGETEQQAQQRRDKATGQFKEGKVRRPKSHQATPDDVEVINQLTRRLKTAEEQYGTDIPRQDGESERAYTLRRRAELVERLGKTTAPAQSAPQAPMQAPPPQQQMPPQGGTPQPFDPQPQENDPKYAENYALYLRDDAAWAAREQIRQYHAYVQHQQHAQQQATIWRQKVEKAKTKYPDYEAVAFKPASWPQGSVPDQFIREHDNGAELLYHLHANPGEIDALSRKSPLQQAEHLTLLLQRLASPSPETAGMNGAATGTPTITLAPKPPTPLRTEPQRPSSGPPPTDGSLPIRQHLKKFPVAR